MMDKTTRSPSRFKDWSNELKRMMILTTISKSFIAKTHNRGKNDNPARASNTRESLNLVIVLTPSTQLQRSEFSESSRFTLRSVCSLKIGYSRFFITTSRPFPADLHSICRELRMTIVRKSLAMIVITEFSSSPPIFESIRNAHVEGHLARGVKLFPRKAFSESESAPTGHKSNPFSIATEK